MPRWWHGWPGVSPRAQCRATPPELPRSATSGTGPARSWKTPMTSKRRLRSFHYAKRFRRRSAGRASSAAGRRGRQTRRQLSGRQIAGASGHPRRPSRQGTGPPRRSRAPRPRALPAARVGRRPGRSACSESLRDDLFPEMSRPGPRAPLPLAEDGEVHRLQAGRVGQARGSGRAWRSGGRRSP